MNKTTANNIIEDMKKAMVAIEKKHGVIFDIAGGSYDDLKFTPKITFVKTGWQEEVFKRDALIMGVNPDVYGKQITYGGETYTIIEINTRARAYPLIAQNNNDGAKTKFRWNDEIKKEIV